MGNGKAFILYCLRIVGMKDAGAEPSTDAEWAALYVTTKLHMYIVSFRVLDMFLPQQRLQDKPRHENTANSPPPPTPHVHAKYTNISTSH